MLRRLLTACLLFALAGCAHRVEQAPAATLSEPKPAASPDPAAPAMAPGATSTPVTRITVPGEAFTRADPTKPLAPSLVVTTQVAHSDLFYASLLGVGPGFHQVKTLYRGQRAYVLPFAVNYAVASDGRTDLTFELSLLKANGSADGAPLHGVLFQGKVTDPRQLFLPATLVNYYAEPGDPLGTCRLTARIQDHLGGDDITLSESFVIADYTPPSLPAGLEVEPWLQTYYQNPAPELALPALAALFEQLTTSRRNTALPTIIGFYDQVLNDNPWLLPAFTTRLAAAEPNEAYALSVVLGFHLRNATQAPSGCTPETWARLESFRTYPWTNPDAAITEADQINCLWGRFFASGLYAPVSRLLEPLDAYADLGATARFNAAQASTPAADNDAAVGPAVTTETPPAVFREQLLRGALWSLGDNAKRHPLVRAYLELTLLNGKLAEMPRTLLSRFLAPPAESQSAKSDPASPADPAAQP
jgi:hypothetical protein